MNPNGKQIAFRFYILRRYAAHNTRMIKSDVPCDDARNVEEREILKKESDGYGRHG